LYCKIIIQFTDNSVIKIMLILNIVKVRRGLFSRKYITGVHNKR